MYQRPASLLIPGGEPAWALETAVPVSTCDVCDRLCLTEGGDPEQERCPRCRVPLRILTLAELLEWFRHEEERAECE
jgi:hypothetical protein